jgi:hypothetical protein
MDAIVFSDTYDMNVIFDNLEEIKKLEKKNLECHVTDSDFPKNRGSLEVELDPRYSKCYSTMDIKGKSYKVTMNQACYEHLGNNGYAKGICGLGQKVIFKIMKYSSK